VGGSWSSVSAGGQHTCALTPEGAAWCWGSNWYGQIGDGVSGLGNNRLVPTQVSDLTSGATSVVAGYHHSCAIVSGGGALCWGSNESGQNGNGLTGYKNKQLVPTQVSGLTSGVTAIAPGAMHTCAIVPGGAVKCWGSSYFGQIGTGSVETIADFAPTQVSGLTGGVTAISARWDHTCAIVSGGAVKCWGDNEFGQIGDGSSGSGNKKPVPTQVSGLTSGVTAIAAGQSHTCAIVSGGAVQCWGDNYAGQIGDGSHGGTKPQPTQVSGLTSGVTAIAAGHTRNCAIVSGGGVKCWGHESYVPEQVPGLISGVTAISCGDEHTCARMSTGEVLCWGSSKFGQLGDGTGDTDASSP